MNRATVGSLLCCGIALVFSPSVFAYMGPSFGLGVIGTIAAVVMVSLLSLTAFVILPVKRMFKKSKKKSGQKDSEL